MDVFFFLKQKTAYEMRISDWSSDVCSSDLADAPARRTAQDRQRDAKRMRTAHSAFGRRRRGDQSRTWPSSPRLERSRLARIGRAKPGQSSWSVTNAPVLP